MRTSGNADANFDVAVVGGGSAGVAAAVTAAQLGARTLLVERCAQLGGNATQAFVHTICGLYFAAEENSEARFAHRGFPKRFAEFLLRTCGARPPERAGRVFVLPVDPARFAAAARAFCESEKGLELVTNCELTAATLSEENGTGHELELLGADGTHRRACAKIAVDASGDGALAVLGGAAVEVAPPELLQHPSYIFRMSGVDTDAFHGFARLRLSHAVAGAARTGVLPPGAEAVLVRTGCEPGDVYITLNIPKLETHLYQPLDPNYRAALEQRARANALAVANFLCETRLEFKGARVSAWPARIGIRETRRVLGDVVLGEADVLRGWRRDDEVALSTWPIEIWHDHRRPELHYPAGACSVPLGALWSRSHPRLGMAGRCLSATHEALGALRVIGTALATGEAVGVAAALAADRGLSLRDVTPVEVRAQLETLAR